jgi:hypothetical protein
MSRESGLGTSFGGCFAALEARGRFIHLRLSPNSVELLDKFICIILGFELCRKGVERFVPHLLIFVNLPAKATGIPDVLCDIGRKYEVLCHDRIMRL